MLSTPAPSQQGRPGPLYRRRETTLDRDASLGALTQALTGKSLTGLSLPYTTRGPLTAACRPCRQGVPGVPRAGQYTRRDYPGPVPTRSTPPAPAPPTVHHLLLHHPTVHHLLLHHPEFLHPREEEAWSLTPQERGSLVLNPAGRRNPGYSDPRE